MALTAGTKLGPYEIQSPLGAGGMGEVYRAKDTRLDRTVAVKILPDHLSSNPDAIQRFEREARTISSITRPHHSYRQFDATADGQRFIINTRPEQSLEPITLYANWESELRK
ncbi:MAG: hypothetical protein ACLPHI_07335 [Terriglobales bacterium]|jgi:eukaryotic-like serine/threonine-protein kinase